MPQLRGLAGKRDSDGSGGGVDIRFQKLLGGGIPVAQNKQN